MANAKKVETICLKTVIESGLEIHGEKRLWLCVKQTGYKRLE